MNLAENLDRTARARGRSAAMTLGDAVTSFGELDAGSRRVAAFLGGRGVVPGDRVGVVVPNLPEFAVLYYGILRAGAVAVPLDPFLDAAEVGRRLRGSGTSVVVAWAASRLEVEPAARSLGLVVLFFEPGRVGDLLADSPARDGVEPRAAGDTAVILFTSGTTGAAKGVELTHGNLVRNCEVVVNDLLQLTSEDVVLGALPLFHCFGQTVALNAAVRAGACLALLARFDAAAALSTLQERRVTVVQGVPSMYAAMLHHPQRDEVDPSPLRVGVSGGAAMPVEVLLGFEEAFRCPVLEGYWLVEASPAASFNRLDRRRVGSAGTPAPGVELRVVDEHGRQVADGDAGEILVRGHNVMRGYPTCPDRTRATIRDGWLRTGDLGVRDEDGFLHVIDRIATRPEARA